jgi:arginine utilization protein RocB
MMEGGKALHQAALADSGAIRQQDLPQNKFETSLEDFHSVLDQMELNLRCALETTNQCQSSQRYMPTTLTYPQYIATAKQQVGFTSDIRQMLKQAAQDIVDHSVQQS